MYTTKWGSEGVEGQTHAAYIRAWMGSTGAMTGHPQERGNDHITWPHTMGRDDITDDRVVRSSIERTQPDSVRHQSDTSLKTIAVRKKLCRMENSVVYFQAMLFQSPRTKLIFTATLFNLDSSKAALHNSLFKSPRNITAYFSPMFTAKQPNFGHMPQWFWRRQTEGIHG